MKSCVFLFVFSITGLNASENHSDTDMIDLFSITGPVTSDDPKESEVSKPISPDQITSQQLNQLNFPSFDKIASETSFFVAEAEQSVVEAEQSGSMENNDLAPSGSNMIDFITLNSVIRDGIELPKPVDFPYHKPFQPINRLNFKKLEREVTKIQKSILKAERRNRIMQGRPRPRAQRGLHF